jgi:hypothetical protein
MDNTANFVIGQRQTLVAIGINQFGKDVGAVAFTDPVLSDPSLATIDASNVVDFIGLGSETIQLSVALPSGAVITPKCVAEIGPGEVVDARVGFQAPPAA